MESSVRDSKVKPIGDLEAGQDELGTDRTDDEEELLLARRDDDDDDRKEEVKPKTKRKVQWNDVNGNELVEIMEFLPSDTSDSDGEEAESCFCKIM